MNEEEETFECENVWCDTRWPESHIGWKCDCGSYVWASDDNELSAMDAFIYGSVGTGKTTPNDSDNLS
jgi:hypothetical protein